MSEPAAGRFVTAVEAGHLLGITARSVRRQIDRLEDADRDIEDTDARNVRSVRDKGNRPVRLVRLSALSAGGEGQTDEAADRDTGKRDADARNVRNVRDALIDQLRSENAFLRAQVERQAETITETVAALRAEQSRSAVLIAAAAQGKVLLPAADSDNTPQPIEPDPGTGEQSAASEGRDGSTGRTESPGASWWARLWRRA